LAWAKRGFFLDDDVANVDLSLSGHPTLEALILEAFDECEKRGAYIWGVYPVLNHYFMKSLNAVTTNLSYIVGAFYGIRQGRETPRLTLTRDGHKEDVERSVRYFLRDGALLRYNLVGIKPQYYSQVGGLGTLKDRIGPMAEAARRLQEAYPDLGYLLTRSSGAVEFRLKPVPAIRAPLHGA
jgi:hypothetical protein